MDTSRVTRFEVIDESGRAYVRGATYGPKCAVELSLQDDGQTLKIFVMTRDRFEEEQHMKRVDERVGRAANRVLRDPKASREAKSVAASALTQTKRGK